jgi:hypothetical protein
MLNFAKYFLRGLKNTLRLQNGVNFSYKGPWIPVTSDTLIDEWYVGDFAAAEYTIVVDVSNIRKEMIKCLVVAGSGKADITIYGRTNINENLVEITATISESKLQLKAQPASSPDGSTYDNSSLLLGGKLIFSATYFYSLNDLTRV